MTAKIEALRPNHTRPGALDLAPIIAELRHSRDVTHNIRLAGKVTEVPEVSAISEALDSITTALFPTHLGPSGLTTKSLDLFVGNALSTSFLRLGDQIARGLRFDTYGLATQDAQLQSHRIISGFAKQLPAIRAILVSDLRAAQRRDASAGTLAEILICHPGIRAIIHYRLAHALHQLGARFVARIISALAHSTTGIDIHPGARIGSGFFIRKGLGISIGETAVIGDDVCLHPGVTLGENDYTGTPRPSAATPRHPIVESNVVIHAGATILGRITIGAGSVIGGNLWVTRSVPPGSVLTQAAPAVGTMQSLE